MLNYIKKSLKGAVETASTINYYTTEVKNEMLAFIDNLQETQYLKLDIQDFDEALSTATLVWNYATKTITNSSGGTSSIVSKKISNDYSTNKIVIDFLKYISTATSHTISISTNDVDYQAIAEVDAEYEISSETGFRVKIELDDGAFSELNICYDIC